MLLPGLLVGFIAGLDFLVIAACCGVGIIQFWGMGVWRVVLPVDFGVWRVVWRWLVIPGFSDLVWGWYNIPPWCISGFCGCLCAGVGLPVLGLRVSDSG